MSKPLHSKLPGRYGSMTRTQLDAMVASLERPIPLVETRAMTAKEQAQWQRAKHKPSHG